jgi:hypothetical protein
MSLKFTSNVDVVTFSGPTTTIPTTPIVATQAEVLIKNRSQIALLVDYTNGDETLLNILVEISPSITLDINGLPAVPALGTDYYAYSDLAGSGAVTVLAFTVAVTSKVRIPVPLLHQERVIRFGVSRTGGSDAGAGSISLKVIDDAHFVTSSLHGQQP